jgi:hypothetical protein
VFGALSHSALKPISIGRLAVKANPEKIPNAKNQTPEKAQIPNREKNGTICGAIVVSTWYDVVETERIVKIVLFCSILGASHE